MKISKYIDHTNLKQDVAKDAITKLCEEAKEYDFFSVCVNPFWVSYAAELLKGTDVEVCTVIGFPLGQNTIATKVFETKDAIANGAGEIDMVINVTKVKERDEAYLLEEINAIKEACNGKLLKVIVETCLLTDDEKAFVAEVVGKSNADIIKTSTGFSTGGATIEDVEIFQNVLNGSKGIKASGGVKSLADAEAMINTGATRIGTSQGIAIIEGLETNSDY